MTSCDMLRVGFSLCSLSHWKVIHAEYSCCSEKRDEFISWYKGRDGSASGCADSLSDDPGVPIEVPVFRYLKNGERGHESTQKMGTVVLLGN